MRKIAAIFSFVALGVAMPAIAQEAEKTEFPTPNEIVDKAAPEEWRAIAASDLLVMELVPDTAGKKRSVVIQLMPEPFSQGWIRNIRKLAGAHWWDGTSINRVQDNYVVQWGDASEKKALPEGLETVPESDYTVDQIDIQLAAFDEERTAENEADWRDTLNRKRPRFDSGKPDIAGTKVKKAPEGWHQRDSYDPWVQFHAGWPLGNDGSSDADARFWPIHCYGAVGVGRGYSPDTGSGAELYTVIGHAPRHLDRNIAVVGRIVEGVENLSSLPRGTGPLGFYETAEERVPIQSIRLASDLDSKNQPRFEYLNTEGETFAKYADARANRRDPFFIVPAGGADICNIPVPVRRVKVE